MLCRQLRLGGRIQPHAQLRQHHTKSHSRHLPPRCPGRTGRPAPAATMPGRRLSRCPPPGLSSSSSSSSALLFTCMSSTQRPHGSRRSSTAFGRSSSSSMLVALYLSAKGHLQIARQCRSSASSTIVNTKAVLWLTCSHTLPVIWLQPVPSLPRTSDQWHRRPPPVPLCPFPA